MSWNAQRLLFFSLILVIGCSAMIPPVYLAVIGHFDELSKQIASTGSEDATSGTNLAPVYGEFVEAFEKEQVSKGSYTVHGPHVLALAELIAETMKINEKLAKLSGSSVGDNAGGSSAGFKQLSFSEFSRAIQEDLKSMGEMNGIEPYVPPAITLLAAKLQEINSRVDALERCT